MGFQNSGASSGGSSDVSTLKTLILGSIVTHMKEDPLVRDNSEIDCAFVVIDNNGDVVFT